MAKRSSAAVLAVKGLVDDVAETNLRNLLHTGESMEVRASTLATKSKADIRGSPTKPPMSSKN